MSKSFDEIRRHFRRETGKLDNWLWHRRLDEYLTKKEDQPHEA